MSSYIKIKKYICILLQKPVIVETYLETGNVVSQANMVRIKVFRRKDFVGIRRINLYSMD